MIGLGSIFSDASFLSIDGTHQRQVGDDLFHQLANLTKYRKITVGVLVSSKLPHALLNISWRALDYLQWWALHVPLQAL